MAKEIRMQSFNVSVKIAGQTVVVKHFSHKQLRGYQASRSGDVKYMQLDLSLEGETPFMTKIRLENQLIEGKQLKLDYPTDNHPYKTEGQQRLEKIEAFKKSNRRARDTIYDIIACNCDLVDRVDYLGERQKIKFMTLTFRDDITDIKEANAMFTDFMKRLSYYHFGVKKNVIKYLAVPELQGKEGWVRENKGVWHFHVVMFNCPYTSNKKSEGRPLERIWGNGFVFINALKRGKDGKEVNGAYVAGYITKYMTKEIEFSLENREMKLTKKDKIKEIYDFNTHEKLGLKNMKRYMASKGIKKPSRGYLRLDKEQYIEFMQVFLDQKQNSSEIFERVYEREMRLKDGKVLKSQTKVTSFVLFKKHIKDLKSFILEYSKTSYNFKELDTIKGRKKINYSPHDALFEWHANRYLQWQEEFDKFSYAGGDMVS